MELSKELVLKTIQTMPEKFTIDEFLDKLLLSQKLEIALEQSKHGKGMTLDEARKFHEKWLK